MAAETLIEWTTRRYTDPATGRVAEVVPGATMNPWLGCTKVSEACRFCYAERDNVRRGTLAWGPGGTRLMTSENYWRDAEGWARRVPAGRRKLVFCASQADVGEVWDGPLLTFTGDAWFHRAGRPDYLVQVPCSERSDRAPTPERWAEVVAAGAREGLQPATMDDARRRLFRLIGHTAPALDWLILTKRPETLLAQWRALAAEWRAAVTKRMADARGASKYRGLDADSFAPAARFYDGSGLMPNVWVGVTVESPAYLGRIDTACRIPAVRRFVSAEPLVAPLSLAAGSDLAPPPVYDAAGGRPEGEAPPGINWVITGGESGNEARPAPAEWFRRLRDETAAAGVPFFFKQHGDVVECGQEPADERVAAAASPATDAHGVQFVRLGKKRAGRLLDGVEHYQMPDSVL